MPTKLTPNADIALALATPLASIRDRRRFIEYEWLKNYAAWQGWPNTAYYTSLADDSIRYFIPALRRALERTNSRILKLLTPKTKWFEVQPFDDTSYANAASLDAYMRFVTRQNTALLPFRRNLSALSRCLLLYDFAVLKTGVAMDAAGDIWPTQRAVDPFSFYVFPETATNPHDALMLFEDTIIPFETYQSFVDANLAEPLAANSLTRPIWPYHLIERFAYRGLTNPSDFPIGVADNYTTRKDDVVAALNGRAAAFVDLTDLWVKRSGTWFNAWLVHNLHSYGDAHTSYRGVPGRTVTGNTPFLARLDKHETPPSYKWTTHRPLPGELYTNSLADDARVLQILFNNQVSQTEEARQMATTGPVIFNQNSKRTQQYRYRNREIWYVDGDVRESFTRLNYEDTSPSGLRMAQVTLGLIDSMAGAGTIAQGQPGRNMPRAGFAVNNLLNLSLSDVQDVAETTEQDVLTPSLMDIHSQTLLYVPPSQLIAIPGSSEYHALALQKVDLQGKYLFEWIGSLEFQDRETKAERLMLFARLLLDAFPIIQQAGYKLDIPQLIQQIYINGIGVRGMPQIIRELTPDERAQQQQQTALQGLLQGGAPRQGAAAGGNGSAPRNGSATSGVGAGTGFNELLSRIQSASGMLGT